MFKKLKLKSNFLKQLLTVEIEHLLGTIFSGG